MHSVKRIPEAITRCSVSCRPDTDHAKGFAEYGASRGRWFSKIIYTTLILGGVGMLEHLVPIAAAILLLVPIQAWKRRRVRRRQLINHSITPEALHDLLGSDRKPMVLDLRLPLDFFAQTEMIPGAHRIAPSEIIANPKMISRDRDYVLYCTCPGEESSEKVLATALNMGFRRVKLLAGGLEAWKQKGYPVEAYTQPFHLDVQ